MKELIVALLGSWPLFLLVIFLILKDRLSELIEAVTQAIKEGRFHLKAAGVEITTFPPEEIAKTRDIPQKQIEDD